MHALVGTRLVSVKLYLQCLFQVLNDVVHIFQSYRHADLQRQKGINYVSGRLLTSHRSCELSTRASQYLTGIQNCSIKKKTGKLCFQPATMALQRLCICCWSGYHGPLDQFLCGASCTIMCSPGCPTLQSSPSPPSGWFHGSWWHWRENCSYSTCK